MHELWNWINQRFEKEEKKRNMFLFLNTVCWSAVVFLIFFLIGLSLLGMKSSVVWNALTAAGYAGFFGGFIGGCIFLMRNTPEQDPDEKKFKL